MRELDKRPANNLPDYKLHLLFSKKAESAGRGADESFNYRQYLRVVESSASPQFYYLLIVRALDGRLIRRGENKLLSGKTKSWPWPIDGILLWSTVFKYQISSRENDIDFSVYYDLTAEFLFQGQDSTLLGK